MTTTNPNLQTQTYSIVIDASKEKVWHATFEHESFEQWTSVFAEGSHVKTDWQEGSEAIFMEKTGQGMISKIAKSQPYDFLSIKHIGMVKDGKHITEGKEIEKWSGALENYTFKDVDGKTQLIIDIDVNDEYKDFFNGVWPKALEKLKDLAEA